MRTGTAPPRADGKHARWPPPCFDITNERKISVRNVDKIKNLKEQLANAQRYAARLEAMCKGQDKQLMEVRQGAEEMQRALSGVLMAAVLSLGEEAGGAAGGWKMRIPAVDVASLGDQYQLRAHQDQEEGGWVFTVVPRGQE